ncbi:MAG: cytochrome P450, partial [Leptospiraceae bacterium]|nr:cytochrome P450 [Leptospiraceae bacterium]
PAFWENPMEFQPERFREGKKNSHGYAYFPFGGGPRLCIGADFAMMESIIILSALVSRFEFESVQDEVSMELLITLRPAGGMPMKIHKRPD